MSTMTFSCRVFPTGEAVPGTLSGTVQVTGPSATLNAAPFIPLPVSPQPGVSQPGYLFIYWNANAALWTTAGAVIPVASTGPNFNATAWYIQVGGSGTGRPGVNAWAFSLTQDAALPDSPFATVVPPGAETGPNTVSTTTSPAAVVMTAPQLIAGSGLFSSWLQFNGTGHISQQVLTVAANGSSNSIAFFAVPQPDPCQDARDNLEQVLSITAGDFPNSTFPPGWHRYVASVRKELIDCEVQYGEPT